jgi:hypothetical protein
MLAPQKNQMIKLAICLVLSFLANQLAAQNNLIINKLSTKHGLKVSKIEDADSLYFPNKWFYVHCTDGTTKIYDAQHDVLEKETILKLHVLDYINFFNISISKTIDGKKEWLIYDKNFSRLGWKPVRINYEEYDTLYYADPLIEYPDFMGVKNNEYTFFKIDDKHAKVNFKTNLKLKDENFSLVNLKEIVPFHAGFIASFFKNDTLSYKKIRRMPTTYTLIDEVDPISKDTITRIEDADSLGYYTIDKNFDADEIVLLPKPEYANAIIKKHHILHVYNFKLNKIIYSGLAKYDLACGELPVMYTKDGFLFENEHYIVLPTYDIKSITYKKVDNDIIGTAVMNMERSNDKKKYEQKWELNFTQKTSKDLTNGIYTLPQFASLDSLTSYYDNRIFLNRSTKKNTGDLKPKRTLPYLNNYSIHIKLADEYFLKNECDSALKYYLLSSDSPIYNVGGYFKDQYQKVFNSQLLLELDQNYLQKELTRTSPEHKKLLCSFFYATGYYHAANSYRTAEVQIQALNELIKQNEAVSEFYFYRGILFANLNKHPEAMADFDYMVKLNPSINNHLRRSYHAINSISFLKPKGKKDQKIAQIALSDINFAIDSLAKIKYYVTDYSTTQHQENPYKLYDLYALRAHLNYRFKKILGKPLKELKKEICSDINNFNSFYKRPENEGKTWFKIETLQKDCGCKLKPINPANF